METKKKQIVPDSTGNRSINDAFLKPPPVSPTMDEMEPTKRPRETWRIW